jgi:ribulose-phosphate 3-epimerase
MKKMIAPSILSADFARLGDEIAAVEKAGADVIHVDVMDGHFVKNITIGPPVVKKIKKCTGLPLDCHLMIENPERYIGAFAEVGADWISVHVEACDLKELLPEIKGLGCKAGAVINPPTPVEEILPFVKLADFVLVMTVNPGFGGQEMIEDCIQKISTIKSHIKKLGRDIPIEVDGGVNLDTIGRVADVGADIVVAGNAIFHAKGYKDVIAKMKKAINA